MIGFRRMHGGEHICLLDVFGMRLERALSEPKKLLFPILPETPPPNQGNVVPVGSEVAASITIDEAE